MELPPEKRPYEKCLMEGAASLSDAELLAVVLRTGGKETNSVELAAEVIRSVGGSLAGLYEKTYRDYMRISGIGRVKAVQIECLKVISERLMKSRSPVKADFSRAELIAERYAGEMRIERQETVKVLFLNAKCRLIREYKASKGTVNASLVPVREILVEAIRSDAVYFVLMHNHPSGDPTPSREDIAITKRMADAGLITGIGLIDHLIFGGDGYISLRERGYIT